MLKEWTIPIEVNVHDRFGGIGVITAPGCVVCACLDGSVLGFPPLEPYRVFLDPDPRDRVLVKSEFMLGYGKARTRECSVDRDHYRRDYLMTLAGHTRLESDARFRSLTHLDHEWRSPAAYRRAIRKSRSDARAAIENTKRRLVAREILTATEAAQIHPRIVIVTRDGRQRRAPALPEVR